MRFTHDSAASLNLIRGYGDGEIRINAASYRGAVIVSATELIHEPEVRTLEQLTALDAKRVLRLEPELVLVGTGPRQTFLNDDFSAPYLRAGVGVEVMDTGAACRSYNVLVSEQ